MGEAGTRWLRIAVGLALVVLALVQVQQFTQALRSQARQRGRLVRAVEAPLRALRPQVAAVLAYPGEQARERAAAIAGQANAVAEVELFDGAGNRLAARPRPAPVEHWLDERQRAALESEGFVTVGPVDGKEARLLTYAAFHSPQGEVVMRVAVAPPDLAEDVREWRQALVSHVMVVLSLLLAAVLVLAPPKQAAAEVAPHVLDAYAEAMTRLRRREDAQSERHRAERERLEEKIRDAGPMARAGELTSGIVHEVRNGLGTILGYARLVEKGAREGETLEAARRIAAECETLETVVRRFMEFVKAETLTLAPLDVRRMLARVAAREASGSATSIEVVAGDEVSVVADDSMLERALENLVRNAREAAGASGHVWLDARREGPQAVIGVADDGPGLPPGGVESLRPFQTTKPGGLGLGLALAVKIVRLHGGDLTMAQRMPRGLSVTVRLPVLGPGEENGAGGVESETPENPPERYEG